MDWDAIGAIGEVLGATAVFVTLVYLAVQLRYARAETRRALSQGRLEATGRNLSLMMGDGLAARIKADASLGGPLQPIVASLIEQTGLTSEEALRLFMEEIVDWNYRLHVITHVDDLVPLERDLFEGATHRRYASGGVSAFLWKHHFKQVGHPDAVAYIERVLAERS
jgi:hypothetical protein